MRIKDLTLPDSKLIRSLKEVADMEVDDFIHMVDSKKASGIRINKPYQRVYDYIKAYDIKQDTPSVKPTVSIDQETAAKLQRIPIEELNNYFDVRLICKLKNGYCNNLLDVYNISEVALQQIPYVGVTMLEKLRIIQESLRNDPNRYIDEWAKFNTVNYLPSDYDSSLGLNTNLRNAILEYAQIIRSNLGNGRYTKNSQQKTTYTSIADVLEKIYHQNKSIKEIAHEMGYTNTRIEQLRNDGISPLLKGEVCFNHYRLNQDLLDLLGSLGEECLFAPIQQYKDYSGSSDISMIKGLGYDTTTINDLEILIPKDTKGICYAVWRAILKVLCDNPLPTDKHVIEQQILDSDDLADINYDTRFIDLILSSDFFIDNKGNNLIQIKNEYLTSVAQRMARIVYESGRKMTTQEVTDKYVELYKVNPTTNISMARQYGISCQGKKYWYYGEPKMPLQQWITEYAEDNKIFYYNDIADALKEAGYTIPGAIRAYITNVCIVDTKDSDHFCLKDCVDEYKKFKWRAPNTYGWANWLYNEIRKILDEKGPLTVSEMIDTLEKRSLRTEYKKIRQRVQWNNLGDYCGVDKPFIVTDGIVDKNKSVYDKTDFELIGLRGIKYPYFRQIRSLVANELKKEDSKSKKVTDIVKTVQDNIDESLNRGTIIRALKDEQHRFSSRDFDVVNENGILIVKWLKKEDQVEPVYVAPASSVDNDSIPLVETHKADDRPGIKFRQNVDYDKLSEMLKRELAFYSRWMQNDNIDLEPAIDLFIDLIRNARSRTIREQLPRDLYEYWFASTDSYDRYRYFTDLTIMFEGLLREVYIRRNNAQPPISAGLMQFAGAFPGLPMLMLRSRDSRGFNRIASDIVLKRNKVAHGEYIEMNSLETAQAITDFVALYVYIVSKYVVPQTSVKVMA